MNYRVIWSDDSTSRLVSLLNSHDSAAIVRAAERLDVALSYCPNRVGESREAGERIGIEAPLVVTYTIDEAERVVRILNVWAPHE